MDASRLDNLRLIRSAQVGPVTYRQLIVRYGSATKAIEAIPSLAARGGGRPPRLADVAAVSREAERARALGASYVFVGEPDYPALLAEMETAPPALIYRGDLSLAKQRCIALVGARNASAAACRFARMLGQGLAAQGVTVVSGLARGIDTAAHQGSLEGGTIGVIASGIDIVYPPENEALQEQVAMRGLLLAEQPPGTQPLARHFPSRNRIIAGLSLGTVVVEAAPKSGSLITARLAGEAGRDVMAVPGSPLDPRTQGCNQLIREGAILIQSVADILEAVGPIHGAMLRQPVDPFMPGAPVDASDAERRRIVDLLGPVPVQVDELIRQSGIAPALVQTVLLELELAARVERHAGGRVSLQS
ncbi:DNA-protecting protein DprA [Sphingobium sp. SCG-1]|uniref:DNA-processing protein DprA n=1 Tax=Sphingobium sp. SCG-1 TaxID=2072936 RepID=UPI000CD69D99|nr:DNA-processing protein DprA [Sphingobium sp. SCG-1]AUW58641.1 DNA-protecting protein DprA [Sphingobium sp. SCG-1]